MNKFLKVPQAIAFAFLFATSIFAQAVWNGKVNTGWYDESKNDFIITTPQQLAGLAELVNSGHNFKGKTVKLGANISLNNTTNLKNWENKPPINKWIPIGNKDCQFEGIFDGNSFTITGVYIKNENNGQGLFRNLFGTIKNVDVTASYIKGFTAIGGLVGGQNKGSIINSYYTGNVTGDTLIGGLAAINGGTISGSYSSGTVTGKMTVGGLVGSNEGATISDSYSNGTVIGEMGVGGLVGGNFEEATISNSYFTGTVIGNAFVVGGLIGQNFGSANNCYSIGKGNVITSYSIDGRHFDTGRGLLKLTAKNQGTISNSYPIKESETDMKLESTFKDWDFNEIWGIKNTMNCGYPYLLKIKGQQDCQDSVEQQQKIIEITELLKTNKFEECSEKCNELEIEQEFFNKKIEDLCKKQLVAKVKSLPKNKLTPEIAGIYYDNAEAIWGDVIQNKNGIILANSLFDGFPSVIMIQTSGHVIGKENCIIGTHDGAYFKGYGKYLGKKTYTTVLGASKTVPNYQLLWCDGFTRR